MDNWLARFDGQTRYTLDINASTVQPDVLRFHGREALSEPFKWDIEFTTPQANIAPEQVLMKYASFRMCSGKNVHGIITRLEWLSTSTDQSHYTLTLSSRLAQLSHTRKCVVFQNQSVPEVVGQVLRKHGLEGPDFEFRLERTYPQRELITQWRETDLQFIQRLLSEVGIYWRTEMDSTRELDVYIFADSQRNYQFGVRLPYSEPSGLFDGAAESVWDVRTWHNVVTSSVVTRDYNYRTGTMPLDATVSVRNDAVTTGEHYRYATSYRDAGGDTDPESETESGAFYARMYHERELNQSARIQLLSNASDLTPGQVLEPQGEVINALREGVIITLATFSAARDSGLTMSIWGMPYTERYCFRPPDLPRPEIHGTLPARIQSREKKDIYAHLDEQGRYRVKLDFDREGTEQGYGYLWLRQAKPFCGETLGWHTPLIDGTEVAIAYSNGDIDLPYIAYALHDSEHQDPVTRDNHTRNILRTPANSKLRMEDQRAEEHIKLATEYGKTQLNTGHLVDAEGKPRGAGTELRTDERGTIRAGKGLFVSADSQPKAQGKVLDMDAALKEIDLLNQQLQQLGMGAEQAQALKADIDSQMQMFEQRLKLLNEVLLFSAPDGVAFTSGEDMQLAASRNVAINAGGDMSAGVMGNMTTLAGERLGLFARSGQLSLKSGEGPIEVQAQNASLRLFAEKKLTLTSESDILFAGKKRITLIGGGSYLRLESGKVEYGTTATYMRRVKKTIVASPNTEPLGTVSLPPPATMWEFNVEMKTPWRTNGLHTPRLRTGNELVFSDAIRAPLIGDSGRQFSAEIQSVPVRTATGDQEWRTTPFVTDLINPQKVKMTNDSVQILCKLDGGGILPFSILRIADDNRLYHALLIADVHAIQPPGSWTCELAYWAPQGGYVDIPLRPNNDDPKFVFTPDFSGCALAVDLLDGNTLRVRHVQRGKENAEYNSTSIEHGKGMVGAMEYPDYGYHRGSCGNWCENITGAAFMAFDPVVGAWILHYQGILHSPAIVALNKTDSGFFSKEKVTAVVRASASGSITHTGSLSCRV